MASFEKARREHGALERLIPVPPVVSGQLGRILDRRTQLAANVTSDTALSSAAIELLGELDRARTRAQSADHPRDRARRARRRRRPRRRFDR
jgi:hypothetical protein